MSSAQQLTAGLNTLLSFLGSLLASYDKLEISKRRYVLMILLPAFGFLLLSIVLAVVLSVPLMIQLPIPLLGTVVFLAAVVYPKIYVSQRRIAIENQFHLVMTHMTVLSTTNIDRMEVFRTLAREEEYGVLAEEIGRVVHLVDTWNQSLDDALRRRAQEVPSRALADFFERLGYTIGAGQELHEFLFSEQEVMVENYITIYEGALRNLEVMKDLYMSMILSMTFALVFAIVLPILTGVNPTLTVAGVIGMFVFVQTGFFFVIRTMSPYDPVWYFPDSRFFDNRQLWGALAIGAFGSMALIVFMGLGFVGVGPGLPGLLFFLEEPRLPLYIAVPVTPLIVTGVVLRREERLIHERDEQFPSFIRALGAAETAKQSTTSKVLETLRTKDFGGLTPGLNRLYRRLNLRISPDQAWKEFSTETKSYLIQKFSEMFLVGRQMGGEPKQLGELISSNMNTVNQLREQRRQATVTLIGLLYGITAAATFAFFIGLEVVNILADLSGDLTAEQFDFGRIIYAGVYEIPVIEYLLLLVILFNAALSALMIRSIDGGNKATAYIHFVLLTWLGCLTAIGTRIVVNAILSI
ncbi:MAG: archaellar assembly protein FlaJ [Halobacteriota archaeon]